MKSVYVKLLIPQIWKDDIESRAKNQLITEAQVIRNALKVAHGYEIDWTEFNVRNPIVRKQPTRRVLDVPQRNTLTLQASLPKYMQYVLRIAAEQKGWSVSSLVAMLLYTSIKDLPGRPELTPFNRWLGKWYDWEDAPDPFLLRASVPKAWEKALNDYAEFNGMKLSKVVHDVVMSKFRDIKEEQVKADQLAKEFARDNPQDLTTPIKGAIVVPAEPTTAEPEQ
jgi:hypothetical protein